MRKWIKLCESYYSSDDEDDDQPELASYILPEGAIVFHGSNGDYEERHGLRSPAWVSNSEKVAEYFADWKDDDGEARVSQWRVTSDIPLGVLTRDYLDYMSEYLNIELDTSDPIDVLQHLRQRGFEGWIIPDNYGHNEADICLTNTDCLKYLMTTRLQR